MIFIIVSIVIIKTGNFIQFLIPQVDNLSTFLINEILFPSKPHFYELILYFYNGTQ